MLVFVKTTGWTILLALVVGLCGTAAIASGATYSLGYGGRLTDATGAPVAGPVDLEVRFYPAATGGSSLLGSSRSAAPSW